jgi:hypothetical protein
MLSNWLYQAYSSYILFQVQGPVLGHLWAVMLFRQSLSSICYSHELGHFSAAAACPARRGDASYMGGVLHCPTWAALTRRIRRWVDVLSSRYATTGRSGSDLLRDDEGRAPQRRAGDSKEYYRSRTQRAVIRLPIRRRLPSHY